MDNDKLVSWLRYLISINRLDTFYHSRHWKGLKKEVLREQHYECQHCKEKGKLTIVREGKRRMGVVHHERFLRDYPELALSKYYVDECGKKQRQLTVLCDPCHEAVHERCCTKEPLNIERW